MGKARQAATDEDLAKVAPQTGSREEPPAETRPSQRPVADMRALVGKPRSPRVRKPGCNSEKRRRCFADADERSAEDRWEGAPAGALVALYCRFHERVYGQHPVEMDSPKEWFVASAAAGRLIKQDFDDDVVRCVAFMLWCWRREEGREKWRREQGREGGRIGWRLQFGKVMLSDWRVDQARRGSKGER